MEKKSLLLPAFLTDSLADACWEHDMMFISELSKLIDIPIDELRKTLLMSERKQSVCIAVDEKTKWFDDIQCPALIKQDDDSFVRCSGFRICFEKKCSVHKTSVSNTNLKWISDTMFSEDTSEYVKIVKDGETRFILKSKIPLDKKITKIAEGDEDEDEDDE
jgi:hypothetical protein